MIMGGGDANSAENIVDGARDSVMSKMNDMMNSVGDAVGGSGGGDGGETGGGIGKYFNMFSSMMSTNGSYGVKQHVAKETQRRASFSSSLPGDGIEIQKILVKQVSERSEAKRVSLVEESPSAPQAARGNGAQRHAASERSE